jgi:ribosomal protein L35
MAELKNSVADKRFRMTATVWLNQNVLRAATGRLLQQCNWFKMEELKNSVADKRFRMTATVWLTHNVWRAATGRLLQQCN